MDGIETMAQKKKISAKELAGDIRRGVDDRSLMEKYAVTQDKLHKLLDTLVEMGAVTRADLDRRNLLQDDSSKPGSEQAWKCPACGFGQAEPLDECPKCGVSAVKFQALQEKKRAAVQAIMRIRRASEFADRLRAYKIVLDGDVIGTIKNGQELEFKVPSGRHQLRLRIDWCGSNIVDFEAQGEVMEFDCGSSLKGWRFLLLLLYVTILRNEYLWLKKSS